MVYANDPDCMKVLILAGICLYREGLASVLSAEPDIEVIGTAGRSSDALSVLRGSRPNVVLVDLNVAGSEDVVQKVVKDYPLTRVAALAVDDVDNNITDLARAGVSGFVSREATAKELVETVRSVSSGELRCSPKAAAKLLDEVARFESRPAAPSPPIDAKRRLTSREMQILGLIEQGLSNKEIASKLCIGVSTVKNHVHNLLEKLSVRRRGEAVARVRNSDLPASHRQPLE